MVIDRLSIHDYKATRYLLCRGQKLLHYLSEVMVNGPKTSLATDMKPASITPTVPEIDYSKRTLFDIHACTRLSCVALQTERMLPSRAQAESPVPGEQRTEAAAAFVRRQCRSQIAR